jgi:hypothetical protein
MKATIDQFILVARNYPVAIVGMICSCRSVVNGVGKVTVRHYCRIRCSAAISLEVRLAGVTISYSGSLLT